MGRIKRLGSVLWSRSEHWLWRFSTSTAAKFECAGSTAAEGSDSENSGASGEGGTAAKAGGFVGGGPDAGRLRRQISRAMDRRAEADAGRRSVVPASRVSLCCDGNLRGPRDHLDGGVPVEPWNDCQRLV